jgi:protocatechuate 3,4-dioxygenase beta subunit
MTEGPFYPEAYSKEPFTQLVRGALQGNAIPLALEGRILDRFGKPVDGARVEIWLADGLGHYTHSRDSEAKQRDPNFAGFGWMKTGADGRYAFTAIRPPPYPGRTPHIHFAVKAPKQQPLITQMFVDGVEQNQRDFIYTHLPRAQRALVTAKLENAAQGKNGQRTTFDLILG